MNSTTGSSLENYVHWLVAEAEKKAFGEVGLTLKIHEGQIVDVEMTNIDRDHRPLQAKRR